MNKEQYHKYLFSANWLIKKSELIRDYLKFGYPISCYNCQSKQNLQVHHLNYNNVGGNEKIDDVCFMCSNCHMEWHKNPKFKNKVIKDHEVSEEDLEHFNKIINSKECLEYFDKIICPNTNK